MDDEGLGACEEEAAKERELRWAWGDGERGSDEQWQHMIGC